MAAEKNFENKIKKYLKDNNCWYVKYFANRMTKSGVPDILACVNGYFIAIEVKAPRGQPGELQIYHRNEIRKSNGIAIIVYPEQWEDFKLLIDDLLQNRDHKIIYDEQKEFDRRRNDDRRK